MAGVLHCHVSCLASRAGASFGAVHGRKGTALLVSENERADELFGRAMRVDVLVSSVV